MWRQGAHTGNNKNKNNRVVCNNNISCSESDALQADDLYVEFWCNMDAIVQHHQWLPLPGWYFFALGKIWFRKETLPYRTKTIDISIFGCFVVSSCYLAVNNACTCTCVSPKLHPKRLMFWRWKRMCNVMIVCFKL